VTLESLSVNLTSDSFYAGALHRIQRFMAVFWVVGTIAALIIFRWPAALGLALGGGISFLNFVWLKRMVDAVADRVTNSGYAESGRGIMVRFLLRYTLMGLIAYGILNVSPASLKGFFGGLFLPVAAIACEAAYQAYAALMKGV
jgi:ATP synthase I chain